MTVVFTQPPRVKNTSPFVFGFAAGTVVESVRGFAWPGATASRIASMTSTTGPLNTVAAGIRSDQIDPGSYTAARSHKMPDRRQQSCSGCGVRASFFICVASRWLGSQYCRTRPSESRPRAELAGAAQSVGSIGCHTANTRTARFASCCRSDSTAEAPRRQVPQVGDNRTMSLVSFALRLNSARSASRAVASIVTRGGWPGGASPGANRYHATAAAIRTTSPATPNVPRVFFIRYGTQSANRPAITCGNTTTSTTITAERLKTNRDEYERLPHALCIWRS